MQARANACSAGDGAHPQDLEEYELRESQCDHSTVLSDDELPGERAPTPTNGGVPRDDATDGASAAALAAAHKEKLAQAVEEHGVGRELIEEWEVRLVARQTGSQVGHFDPQYVSPGGKRFRSRAEALRHLGLQESKPKLPK